MSRLIKFDPFHELRRTMFSGFPFEDGGMEWENALSVDMYETETDVILETDLPGVNPEDVDIQVTSDSVTIQAEKKQEIEEKKKDWVRRERSYGKYSRTLNLPVQVVADKAEAEFADGTLKLIIPKEQKTAPRMIKVKAKAKNNQG